MRFEYSRPQAVRFLVTAAVVLVAVFLGWRLFLFYEYDPWTRDGRVKADVVQIAPDVTGQVVSVNVVDNQPVKKGDVLFEIDRERFVLALRQAEARVKAAQVALAQAKREDRRNRSLGNLVAHEIREQGRARVDQLEADLALAIVARDTAKLDLERSRVAATVNGYVTNLNIQVGTYVTASHPVIALIDSDSLYVEGYFEETKLAAIHPGDLATISLMGEDEKLSGRVQSVASGIFDRERSTGANLLQNINPSLNWVRLVQRIPVRIAFESVPAHIRLVAGQTANITIHTAERVQQRAEPARMR
ncbi:MAG: efflux RND transporter periplasmic adaptor subunit [Alistipes senegalensis]|nr:efflux RND transporter periplasmic adaptor subunit [Oxalobacter formigenes]MCM1281610.1 efflux RND transporter periplasmic adaptor subunit [Alistipes senegalensis]